MIFAARREETIQRDGVWTRIRTGTLGRLDQKVDLQHVPPLRPAGACIWCPMAVVR